MSSDRRPASTGRSILPEVLAIGLSVAVVGVVMLSLYGGHRFSAPAGFDTPKHLWRANLVAGQGLEALAGSSPYREHADRPGVPVVAAFIRSVTGIDAFDLAFALPAVAGTLTGLAAGALAVRVLKEPRWSFPVYAVLVGVSVNIVMTAPGLFDNLMVDPLVAAAAATALMYSNGERTAGVTFGLVAAATLVHWPLTAVFVVILAILAAATLPAALRRGGPRLRDTPFGRLGTLAAGSAGVMAAALALLSVPLEGPRVKVLGLLRKLARFLPPYHLGIIGPAAAVGAAALWLPREAIRRRGLALAVIWAATVAVAVPLLTVFRVEVPAHRLLGFALGIPILSAAAVAGLARLSLSLRPRRAGMAVAAAIVAGSLAGGVVLARAAWDARAVQTFRPAAVAQAAAAGRYLHDAGNVRPAVFVVDPTGPRVAQAFTIAFGVIRSALPPDQISLAYVYLGDVEDLLAGRPTIRPGNRKFNRASTNHWRVVREILPAEPSVIVLMAFNDGLPETAEPVAAGVWVVRGPPAPSAPIPLTTPTPPSLGALALRVIAALAVLAAVGAGWSVALVPGGMLARAALAPAVGLAVLVVGGTAAGRVGLDGPGARPWVAAALLIAGGAWAAVRRPRTG